MGVCIISVNETCINFLRTLPAFAPYCFSVLKTKVKTRIRKEQSTELIDFNGEEPSNGVSDSVGISYVYINFSHHIENK